MMSGCECPLEDPAVLQGGDFSAHSSSSGGLAERSFHLPKLSPSLKVLAVLP